MTKARNEYIYQLKGTILSRTLTQASPESKYAGQEYYNLKISPEDKLRKTVQVFEDKLTNPTIWPTLKQTRLRELSGKKYLFKCRNSRGYYYLVDWEEIPQESPKEASQ